MTDVTDEELAELVKQRLPVSVFDRTCTRCRATKARINLSMDEKVWQNAQRTRRLTPKSAPVCDECLELWCQARDRLALQFLAGLDVQ